MPVWLQLVMSSLLTLGVWELPWVRRWREAQLERIAREKAEVEAMWDARFGGTYRTPAVPAQPLLPGVPERGCVAAWDGERWVVLTGVRIDPHGIERVKS